MKSNLNVPSYEDTFKALKGPKGFRRTKTGKNGFYDYVWRMARFYSGIDAHMPVNCYFWLQDWAGWDSKTDPIDSLKCFQDIADDYAFKICQDYELGSHGLVRWGRIFGTA